MNKIGTLRFEVSLDLESDNHYEISIMEMVKFKEENPDTEFSENNVQQMHNYVSLLEKKYGTTVVVKGKKVRVKDYCNIGSGYDVDDPFIDDSELIDDIIVAPDLMTNIGGFFVNSEMLKINESNFVIEKVEGQCDTSALSKKNFQTKNHNKITKSQQLVCQARKRLSTTAKKVKKHLVSVIENNASNIANTGCKNGEINEQMPIKDVDRDTETPSSASSTNQGSCKVSDKPVDLPSNLSLTVQDQLKFLMEAAEKYKSEGKKSSDEFNTLLMKMDTTLIEKDCNKAMRTQILKYVSVKVDMRYDAVLRRISSLKEKKKKQQLQPLLQSLRVAIKEAMPESLAKYDAAYMVYVERIAAQKALSNNNSNISNNTGMSLTESQCSSMLEQSVDQESEPKPKKILKPRTSFKWTNRCKGLFHDLVLYALESYKPNTNKKVPDDFLSKFFTTYLMNLWEPKWMSVVELTRMSLPILTEFNNKTLNLVNKEFKLQAPVKKLKRKNKSESGTVQPQQPSKDPPTKLASNSASNNIAVSKTSIPVDAHNIKAKPLSISQQNDKGNTVLSNQNAFASSLTMAKSMSESCRMMNGEISKTHNLTVNTTTSPTKCYPPSSHNDMTTKTTATPPISIPLPDSKFIHSPTTMMKSQSTASASNSASSSSPSSNTAAVSGGTNCVSKFSKSTVDDKKRLAEVLSAIVKREDTFNTLFSHSISKFSPPDKIINQHQHHSKVISSGGHDHQQHLQRPNLQSTPIQPIQQYHIGSQYVHSTQISNLATNVSPNGLLTQQIIPNIQELPTIFPRQSISQISPTKHTVLNISPNIQQIQKSYMDIISESQGNPIHFGHHNIHQSSNSDLSKAPASSVPTISPQHISPSMFINMNKAHFQTHNHYQN